MPLENPVPREEKAQAKPVEYQDPERALDAKELNAIKEELAASPEQTLEEYFYIYQKNFYDMLVHFHKAITTTGDGLFTDRQTDIYNRLQSVIFKEMAEKRTQLSGQTVTNFKEFWAPIRKAERICAQLEQTLADEGLVVNRYEDYMHRGWLDKMLTEGVKTGLMKDGKNPEIQSFVVPKDVDVTAMSPADFMVLASERECTGPDATAYNKYARKIAQSLKQIHLKVPTGTTPQLKFEWTDAATNCKMESTVTGEKDAEGRWQFFPSKHAEIAEGQQVIQPAPQPRRLFGGSRR